VSMLEAIASGDPARGRPHSGCLFDRAAREGRNPATGEHLHIPTSKAAKFSAAAKLKRALNP
jgi:hypothetical protein